MLKLLEGQLVHIGGHQLGAARGAAAGEVPNQVKVLQGANEGHGAGGFENGHQQGDGDFKQVLPAVGAVDDGRLVNGGIDIAVPRDEVDHVEGRKTARPSRR